MPKRRRLLTPMKKKAVNIKIYNPVKEELLDTSSTPRGRLKGALKDALDPAEESDDSVGPNVSKRNTNVRCKSESSSDEEEFSNGRPPYVLKLFDRSVDLSQFEEDSPLYPICRAWIANQPKMCYKKIGKRKYKFPEPTDESVELPGPEGPVVSRIPKLLPRQREQDNLNLDAYLNNAAAAAAAASREALLSSQRARWAGVRRAWLENAARVEARYDAAQKLLNKINVINIGI